MSSMSSSLGRAARRSVGSRASRVCTAGCGAPGFTPGLNPGAGVCGAVVRGTAREHADRHPALPVLVVEVAQSSVGLDRHHKASLYARAAVPEYWIVDIVDEVLEVYRRPVPSPAAVYGSSYADVQRFPRGATVFPLAASTTPVVVTDLMI